MKIRLPGRCVVCGRDVVWTGKSWKNPGQYGGKHRCPEDRPTCNALMPMYGDRCARRPGHRFEHRSAYTQANMRSAQARKRAADGGNI
jgi:hypothetical protein